MIDDIKIILGKIYTYEERLERLYLIRGMFICVIVLAFFCGYFIFVSVINHTDGDELVPLISSWFGLFVIVVYLSYDSRKDAEYCDEIEERKKKETTINKSVTEEDIAKENIVHIDKTEATR